MEITTNSLAAGQVGVAYSRMVEATDGTTPYKWNITSGALPPGLILNAETGLISGTPTKLDSYSFTAKVTDSTKPTAETATKSFTIAMAAAATPVKIAITSVPSGQIGIAYLTTLAATGGSSPYNWSVTSGALPGGLALTAATGSISGIPTTSREFQLCCPDNRFWLTRRKDGAANFSISIASGSGWSVQLNWTASPSSGVTGYNVYRSQESGNGFAKINSSVVKGLAYTDGTVLNGQTYYYVTTSANARGAESTYSEQVAVTIP